MTPGIKRSPTREQTRHPAPTERLADGLFGRAEPGRRCRRGVDTHRFTPLATRRVARRRIGAEIPREEAAGKRFEAVHFEQSEIYRIVPDRYDFSGGQGGLRRQRDV